MVEKKYIAIVTLALSLAMIPACANKARIGVSDEKAESFPMDVFSDDLSENAKTFLICPDGAEVRVSEITEIYSGNEKTNNKTPISLSQAEDAARGKRDFKVKCEGFAYGYFPEPSFDRESSPDKFDDAKIGTEYDRSSEFFRVKKGDKFGTLTVKNACSFFNTNWNLNSLSDASGAYYSGSLIEYDGDIELTGLLAAEKNNSVSFYPDGDSITKIPYTYFKWNNDKNELYHCKTRHENWCGDYYISGLAVPSLPNSSYNLGSETGGEPVRVKVTLTDIVFERGLLGSQSTKATLKSITAI